MVAARAVRVTKRRSKARQVDRGKRDILCLQASRCGNSRQCRQSGMAQNSISSDYSSPLGTRAGTGPDEGWPEYGSSPGGRQDDKGEMSYYVAGLRSEEHTSELQSLRH